MARNWLCPTAMVMLRGARLSNPVFNTDDGGFPSVGGLGAAGEQGDGEVERPVVVAAGVVGFVLGEVVLSGEGGEGGADLGCGAGEYDAGLAVGACPGPDGGCCVGVVLTVLGGR